MQFPSKYFHARSLSHHLLLPHLANLQELQKESTLFPQKTAIHPRNSLYSPMDPPSSPSLLSLLLQLLPLLLLRSVASAAAAKNIGFDFPSLSIRNLTLLGDSHLRNGSVGLTRDCGVPSSSAGTALFNLPVPFRDPRSNLSASFSTQFSFSITNPDPNPISSGDGLVFFLSPDNHTLGSPGAFLGLFNASGNSSAIGVEFDTLMDQEFGDPDDNHVGLDVGGPSSVESAGLSAFGVELKSGNVIMAWIDYYDDEKKLVIWAGYSSLKPEKPALEARFDLSKLFEEFMYVGFSASTEGSTEIHTIESWSFRTFGFPAGDPYEQDLHNVSDNSWSVIPAKPVTESGENSHKKLGLVLKFAIPATFGVALMMFVFLLLRRRIIAGEADECIKTEIFKGLRQFRYQELFLATKGFHSSRIVGTGAFGTVYRAMDRRIGISYAVKRSKTSHQSRSEFMAEFSVIASLRHRNLVQLQGWCSEKNELLLVYEFMPNGSLDKALYDGAQSGFCPTLDWTQRYSVAVGIASVLAYLHEECEQQVIHRDIKTSNIMLDAQFNARLGDFGLARLLEHDKTPVSTLTAGTMGYLAPEYLQYGKATDKSDVYSYGVVLLEVCCGRRPIDVEDGEARKLVNLVDWVWSLYSEDMLIEAADQRLNGEFDEEQMMRLLLVGLSCANPISSERPSMRKVLQILSCEAEPVAVPKRKPCLALASSAPLDLKEIVTDCSEIVLSSQLNELRVK